MSLRNRILFLMGSKSDPARLSRAGRVALFLTGPWMILPWLILLGLTFDLPYDWHIPETGLFLEGDNDVDGAMLFAFSAFTLLFFAFIAAWHLSFRLRAFRDRVGFGRRLGRSLAVMSPFLALFLLVIVQETRTAIALAQEACFSSCDADVLVATFSAAIVSIFTLLFVTWLDGTCLPKRVKTLLAPAAAVLWLFLGWDGQTSRAGQRITLRFGEPMPPNAREHFYMRFGEPLPAARGVRHGIMLAWHRLCLQAIGWHQSEKPTDSPLWFWTDGEPQFGANAGLSRSAQSLLRRSDLPWTEQRSVFVVPIPATDDTPLHTLFPYGGSSPHVGYFLQTPDDPVRILHGYIEPLSWHSEIPPISINDGQPYWALLLRDDGTCLGERRTVDWNNHHPSIPPAEPFTPSPQNERITVQLTVDGEATFASFTNCLLTLRRCGFGNVFVR